MFRKALRVTAIMTLCLGLLAGCESSPSGSSSGSASSSPEVQAKTLRIGIMVSTNTAHAAATREFAKLVEEKSKGTLKVAVYTDGTLGNEVEMWEGIQSGSVDMMWTGDGAVSSYVPEWGFVALPFIFASQDHRDTFINSGAVDALTKIVEEKGNVVVLGNGNGASRNLLIKKKIETLPEAAGTKMRVQASEIVVKTWEALGLLPVVIAYAETYSALQTGVAHACENEMSSFLTQKWYETCPFLIKTEHQINCHPLIIGKKQFAALTPEQQTVLREAGKEAAAKFLELERAGDAEGDKTLVEKGGVTIVTLKDKDAWIAATKAVRDDFCKKYGLEELAAKVEALRK